jgi:hypothetical protein
MIMVRFTTPLAANPAEFYEVVLASLGRNVKHPVDVIVESLVSRSDLSTF